MIQASELNPPDLLGKKQIKDNPVNELNGFFISHFFKLMYSTVDAINNDEGIISNSGEKVFRDFLLNEYGNKMSNNLQLTNDLTNKYIGIQPKIVSTNV